MLSIPKQMNPKRHYTIVFSLEKYFYVRLSLILKQNVE